MSNEVGSDYFREVLESEVATVVCGNCGSEVVVNKVYLPYLPSGRVKSCKNCPVEQ